MSMFFHLIIGFAMAFFGLASPGMLNMTTVRKAIKNGQSSAFLFACGAAIIVSVHAFIALYFAEFLISKPEIIALLGKLAIPVFMGLSIFFYWISRKEVAMNERKPSNRHFLSGIMMSSLNMLGIPFYLGLSTYLADKGILELSQANIIITSIGASLGAIAIFMVYGIFAQVVSRRLSFVAKNINLILAIFFLILAILTTYNQFLNYKSTPLKQKENNPALIDTLKR